MNPSPFTLSRTPHLSIPISDIEKLLAEPMGDAALLYLYMLKSDGVLQLQQAASVLSLSQGDVTKALSHLQRLGLVAPQPSPISAEPTQKLAPAPELPEYSAEDVTQRSLEDPGFQAVVSETQRIFGRMLSSAELRSLFAIFDYLRLPPEVMLMLIHHCAQVANERHGDGRLPSMRSIEKEAYLWSDQEILTLERAEEYLQKQKEKSSQLSQIKDVLQLRSRDLIPSERKYIYSWMDMGFSDEAIAIAYERTILRTGKLAWAYMDKILRSWHQKGLHTLEQIHVGDAAPGDFTPAASEDTSLKTNAASGSQELARMKRLLEHMKKG